MIQMIYGILLFFKSQKKLELKRSQVDLQKNTYLALFMMLLLSLEWGYRLIRKMV